MGEAVVEFLVLLGLVSLALGVTYGLYLWYYSSRRVIRRKLVGDQIETSQSYSAARNRRLEK